MVIINVMISPGIVDYIMIIIVFIYLVSRWVDYQINETRSVTSLARIITETIVVINVTCNGFKYFSMGSWEKKVMCRMEKIKMDIKEYITDMKMDMVQAANKSEMPEPGGYMSSKDFSNHLIESVVKNLDTKKYFKKLGVDIVDILAVAEKHDVDQIVMCQHICNKLGASLFRYAYSSLTIEDKSKTGAVPAFFDDRVENPQRRLISILKK